MPQDLFSGPIFFQAPPCQMRRPKRQPPRCVDRGQTDSCQGQASLPPRWSGGGSLPNGGSAHHTTGQTSETFFQAISRCSVTPSTTRGGGIRIISPFSNRTPRACIVPIRSGAGAASTVVTSCLPSYVYCTGIAAVFPFLVAGNVVAPVNHHDRHAAAADDDAAHTLALIGRGSWIPVVIPRHCTHQPPSSLNSVHSPIPVLFVTRHAQCGDRPGGQAI